MGLFTRRSKKERTEIKRPYTAAVIVAAGESLRMGGEDKLFAVLGGIPVIIHSLLRFQASAYIDEIVIVARAENIVRLGDMCKTYGLGKVKCITRGGETRAQSSLYGLMEISSKSVICAIHDGARPLVSEEIISETIRAAIAYGAAIPAMPVKNTVKTVSGNGMVVKTLSRDNLYEAQTPQVFKAELIKAALTQAMSKDTKLTDDAMAVEALGVNVKIVEGSAKNIKITFPHDLYSAEKLLEM